jgi:hypothetical protein
MLKLDPKDAGEWIVVGGTLKDPKTGKPVDLTGCTVVVTVRSGSIGGTVVLDAVPGEIIEAKAGDFQVGFRLDMPGTYYGAVTADKGGAPGWPAIEQFSVQVVAHP